MAKNIDDLLKEIGQSTHEGGFEEALGKIRSFALDQSIQQAQQQFQQKKYGTAREAIAEAERYAFSDEEKGRVTEVKKEIYQKSIEEALYEATTFMSHEPVTHKDIRKALGYCQKAQGYAMSIGENIIQRIDDIVGFRYEPDRGDFPFQEYSGGEPNMEMMIESVNEALERMQVDFRIGPVYRVGDCIDLEVLSGAFGIYQRRSKYADPADKQRKSWIEAMNDAKQMVNRKEE